MAWICKKCGKKYYYTEIYNIDQNGRPRKHILNNYECDCSCHIDRGVDLTKIATWQEVTLDNKHILALSLIRCIYRDAMKRR